MTTTLHLHSLILFTLVGGAYPSCISLQGSQACPKFSNQFFSQQLDDYTFLQSCDTVHAFDLELNKFIAHQFTDKKFRGQFTCPSFDAAANFYARFTKTVLCASIVQLSSRTCAPTTISVPTVCASTCAAYAESEATIMASSQCGLAMSDGVVAGIRQDYALCSTPPGAYTSASCVDGLENEPVACGFADNRQELCNYCHLHLSNTTDTCCDNIARDVCNGLSPRIGPPVITLDPNSTKSATVPSPPASSTLNHGLLALIIVSAIFGLSALICALTLLFWKRQKAASIRDRMQTLNQSQAECSASLVRNSEPMQMSSGNTLAAYRHTSSAMSELDSFEMTDSPACTPISSHRCPKVQTPPVSEQSTMITTSPTASDHIQSRFSSSPIMSLAESTSEDSFAAGGCTPSFVDQYSGQTICLGTTVKCLHDYDPILPDEMQTRAGDRIQVVEIYDDSWCKGILLGSEGSLPRAFPSVCVCAESYDPESSLVPGRRTSSVTITGPDIAALDSVPEETCASEPDANPVLPTRVSISRFREHVDSDSK